MTLWALHGETKETQFAYELRNITNDQNKFYALKEALKEPDAAKGLMMRDKDGNSMLMLALRTLKKNRDHDETSRKIRRLIEKMAVLCPSLIELPTHIDTTTEEKKSDKPLPTPTLLHFSLKENLFFKKILQHIATKKTINLPDANDLTVLNHVLRQNPVNEKFVSLLLEQGADPLLPIYTESGNKTKDASALHFTARKGLYNVCKIISNHLTKPEAAPSDAPPLEEKKSSADSKGDTKGDTKEQKLDAPKALDTFDFNKLRDPKTAKTPLHVAVENKQYDIIYLLLRKFNVSIDIMKEALTLAENLLEHLKRKKIKDYCETITLDLVDTAIQIAEQKLEKTPSDEKESERKHPRGFIKKSDSESEQSDESDENDDNDTNEESEQEVLYNPSDDEESSDSSDEDLGTAEDDFIVDRVEKALTPEDKLREIHELLTLKIKEKVEYSKKEKYHWISSLNFSFYKRNKQEKKVTEKPRWIETMGDQHHLRLLVSEGRKRPPEEKDSMVNFSSAGINFIVSTQGGYVDDRFVPFDTVTYAQVMELAGGKEKYISHLKALNIQPDSFRINAETCVSSLSTDTVDEAQLEVHYSHSEQGIYWSLLDRETLKNTIYGLRSLLTDFSPDRYKIEAIQILIFTKNYMCQNCQATGIAIQNNEKFPELLNTIAEEKGFRVKTQSQLPINVVISSTQPFIPKFNQIKTERKVETPEESDQLRESFRITSEMKDIVTDTQFDLRTMPRGHIFLHDLYGVTNHSRQDATSFISSKKYYDIYAQGALTLYKKIEMENQRLKSEISNLKKKLENEKSATSKQMGAGSSSAQLFSKKPAAENKDGIKTATKQNSS